MSANIIFILVIFFGNSSYRSMTSIRVGGFDKHDQCIQQGNRITGRDDGHAVYGAWFACVPVNHP